MSVRLHSRFVFTPTGAAHLAHAHVARLNYRTALDTGGTYTYRFENVLAACSNAKWRDDRRVQAEENLDDMTWMGLPPSSCETLRDQGFEPIVQVFYQTSSTVTKHYYRLFGLEAKFGPWPPPYPQGAVDNDRAIYLDITGTCVHPYVILNRVVEDIETGRNTVIRGADITREASAYGIFAAMILGKDGALPKQVYVPVVHLEGGQCLSSSDVTFTPPFHIRAVRESGRAPEEVFEFMDRYLWRDKKQPDSYGDAAALVPLLEPNPVIPVKPWRAFMKGGKR